MKTSQAGIDSLKKSEGVRLKMYKDVAGLPTIGVGHLLTRSELMSGKIHIAEADVRWGDGLSMQQVETLLHRDLFSTEFHVNDLVKVALGQHQFDALVSFTFNVGGAALAGSQLLKKLNAGDYASIPDQMRRWFYAGGQPREGLKIRREEEVRLWKL